MAPLTAQEREWVSAVIDSAIAKALIEVKSENSKLHSEFMKMLNDATDRISAELKDYVDKSLTTHRLQCQERRFNVLFGLLAGAAGGIVTGAIIDGNNIFCAIRSVIETLF